MINKILGIHHITALASDPQQNYDFYAGFLGLRLVKKTINYDAPEVYHLYYGNEVGSPGTILTFFPYPNLPKGRKGNGQLIFTSFSIAQEAISFWKQRFERFNFSYEIKNRFNEEIISFEDPDGLGLELVGSHQDERKGYSNGMIPDPFSIKGFYGVTLAIEKKEKTESLLQKHLNYHLVIEKDNRSRFSINNDPGNFVDIVNSPERGIPGAGTIHHIAFSTENETTQKEIQEEIRKAGFNVTPIIDRQYFHSIYFRESGGVLFEVATLLPGFSIDESISDLGKNLKLPSWEEKNRTKIESQLLPIKNSGRFHE